MQNVSIGAMHDLNDVVDAVFTRILWIVTEYLLEVED